ncbi:uncharacterized protein EDB91DRAFT_1235686 [Suillus paluster]|uniref:uncharacterized protein n=1 Tax=Suillus paluster TaxID=48578 RepID=UPI001B8785B2|nr:uncharacterized protein EDB91DRAFT_1235686 [Suillus paluster]KAG1748319.1 hypothetical protein EDB91DRAFT_1235686 [Suillus paluster]
MLLVHNPHPPPFMSPNISHRRHPSAPPAVVVQATKTPGLLFISKQPSRPSTPRNHNQQPQSHHQKQIRSSKPKQPVPQSQGRATQPPIPEVHSSDEPSAPKIHSDAVENCKKLAARPATSSPDKSAREALLMRKLDAIIFVNLHHLFLSQAEGATSLTQTFTHRNNNPASNSFDPFVVSSDSDSENSATVMTLTSKNSSSQTPALTSQPTGKLATRRRRHVPQQLTTPTPATRAVPVPRANTHHIRPNISRSVTTPPDVDDNSPPSTPTRERSATTWQQLAFGEGPRTAPLNAIAGFPFGGRSNSNTPSPTHRHYRTPSEGVFHMSFDEDMASTSDASEEQQKLFGFMPRKHGLVGPSATRAGKDKAGFFASSVFQNSPSPDELPPPAF